MIPKFSIGDVATTRLDGVVALGAGVIGVECNRSIVLMEVLGEAFEVTTEATNTVGADEDFFNFSCLFRKPFGITKVVTIKGGEVVWFELAGIHWYNAWSWDCGTGREKSNAEKG